MSIYRNIPKIELHCHLDGSVRPSTLKEISISEGLLDENKLANFNDLIHVPADCKSLVDYLSCFSLPLAVMQSATNLQRIAQELVEDVAETGVKYIEVRFAPHLHMEKGLSFDAIVTAVLAGLKEGELKTGTLARLILCCMRHLPVEKSIEVVKQGYPFLGKGVVAVDLAGDEHHYPPELHVEAFNLAKEMGYKITIHAGETGIGANVKKSIELLHADRIGHGLYIKDHAESYDLVRDLKTPLEMCPSSNVQTKGVASYAAHPILKFLKEGLCSTLNTDNMTVSNITMVTEGDYLETELGASAEDFYAFYRNSVEAAFATSEEKAYLLKFIE